MYAGTCTCTHWGLKSVFNPSELELQTAVGCSACYIGARIWTQIFSCTARSLNHWALLYPLSHLTERHSLFPRWHGAYISRWSEGNKSEGRRGARVSSCESQSLHLNLWIGSDLVQLVFSDYDWLHTTETKEIKTTDKEWLRFQPSPDNGS